MHHGQQEPDRELSFSLGTPPLPQTRSTENIQFLVGIKPDEIPVVSLFLLSTSSAIFLPLTPKQESLNGLEISTNMSTSGVPSYTLGASTQVCVIN